MREYNIYLLILSVGGRSPRKSKNPILIPDSYLPDFTTREMLLTCTR